MILCFCSKPWIFRYMVQEGCLSPTWKDLQPPPYVTWRSFLLTRRRDEPRNGEGVCAAMAKSCFAKLVAGHRHSWKMLEVIDGKWKETECEWKCIECNEFIDAMRGSSRVYRYIVSISFSVQFFFWSLQRTKAWEYPIKLNGTAGAPVCDQDLGSEGNARATGNEAELWG
jgi:hypothetical protein